VGTRSSRELLKESKNTLALGGGQLWVFRRNNLLCNGLFGRLEQRLAQVFRSIVLRIGGV
jgi:hypothetical protein